MTSGTVRRMQSITRDGGRTFHTCEVDEQGNPVGPSRLSTREAETVPRGLSAIPARVSRFLDSSASCLIICSVDHQSCCSVMRARGRLETFLTVDWRQHAGREQCIRDLFARNGITPFREDRGDKELYLHFALPDAPERIAYLSSEVLASCHGIAESEPLVFCVIAYS